MNGKSVRIGIVAIFLILVTIGLVAANPHGCPPGQGQCKLVQHVVTGKTKCLPLQAVAHPWIVIGDCNSDPKPVDPTATNLPPVIDVPPISVPPTAAPTATPTSVVPTAEPTDQPVQVSPTCTQTPTFAQPDLGDCDICLELRRQADALERIASAQETQTAKP